MSEKENSSRRKFYTAQISKLTESGSTKAYASVNIAGAMAVHGIRIIESKKGLFVSMPATSYIDSEGNTKYSDICHPITAESRTALINSVMDAYKQALAQKAGETQSSAEKVSESEDEALDDELSDDEPFNEEMCPP